MGVATYNWKYKSGSLLPNGQTVPVGADDVAQAGFIYIAHWGNDTTGNGSRMRPFKTVTVDSKTYIISSGVYRNQIVNITGCTFIADGNVTFDYNYKTNNFEFAYNSNFYNIKIIGSSVWGCNISYTLLKGCEIKNLTIISTANNNGIQDTVISNSSTIYVEITTVKQNCYNTTFHKINNLKLPNLKSYGGFIGASIFSSVNISFSLLEDYNRIEYCLFHNCNFKLTAGLGSGGALLPTVPSGYVNYTNITDLRNAMAVAGVPLPPSGIYLKGCTIADPLFNNEAIGDFTLALNSPAKNLSYYGTYVGAKSIGLALKVRANDLTSDFDNLTAVNLTIADDSLTLASTASIGSIETKVKENPNGREFKALPTYGTTADRNGHFVDATSDLATTTISAGTAILTNTPYKVEVGSIYHNGTTYQPGEKFNSASTTSFTTGASGEVREILEAPARENVEARFTDGAGTTIDNTATLVVDSWYYVESGTATYNGTAYTIGTLLKVVSGVTSFTGTGILRLVFSTSDAYSYYEINQLPTSNNTGNAQTGAIVRGNGDKDFDRTPANVFKITKRFFQMRYTIQINNLTP